MAAAGKIAVYFSVRTESSRTPSGKIPVTPVYVEAVRLSPFTLKSGSSAQIDVASSCFPAGLEDRASGCVKIYPVGSASAFMSQYILDPPDASTETDSDTMGRPEVKVEPPERDTERTSALYGILTKVCSFVQRFPRMSIWSAYLMCRTLPLS